MNPILFYRWLIITLIPNLWFLIYPKPHYDILFSLVMAVPLLTILINYFDKSRNKPKYEFSTKSHSEKNSFSIFFSMAGWVLAFRIWLDFDFENSTLIYYPIGICITIFVLFLILPYKNVSSFLNRVRKLLLKIILTLNILLYLLIAVYGVNCIFDYSEPIVYRVKTLGLFGGHRPKIYNIKLPPWGNIKVEKHIIINRASFKNYHWGDTIQVNYKKGLFNIPWYYLTGNEVL